MAQREAKIRTGTRCGWPADGACKEADSAHSPPAGERRTWTYHDVQCQQPNPDPGPQLDGYPECSLIDEHAGECDYVRHAAEKETEAIPAAESAPEPEAEI